MTKASGRLAAALILLITASPGGALAQMGFPTGPGQMPTFPMNPGQMPGMPSTGSNCSMIDGFKSLLGITDAQRAVWDAYVEAMRSNAQALQGREAMTAGMSGKSMVEQLDVQVTAAENRLKALKNVKPALTALYAALNADQKKKADQVLGMACII
jgi:LTXXQ motif family protein